MKVTKKKKIDAVTADHYTTSVNGAQYRVIVRLSGNKQPLAKQFAQNVAHLFQGLTARVGNSILSARFDSEGYTTETDKNALDGRTESFVAVHVGDNVGLQIQQFNLDFPNDQVEAVVIARQEDDVFEFCTAGGCVYDPATNIVEHTPLCRAYNATLGIRADAIMSQMGDDSLFIDTYGLVEKYARAANRSNPDQNQPHIRAAAALLFARRELEACIRANHPEAPEATFAKGQVMPVDHYYDKQF